ENVDRLLREADPNESRIHIVSRACKEVARPITFAIFIIVVVFLPLFTLPNVYTHLFVSSKATSHEELEKVNKKKTKYGWTQSV
ncbi:MAG: hypothetical protein ACE5HI_12500, partial [bacterium]